MVAALLQELTSFQQSWPG